MPKLTVELVPETSWYSNLRSELTEEQWDTVRRRCYVAADYRCEVCGGRGPKWPVECHEVWSYDDLEHVQTLVRTIALCPACHEVKHIGLAGIRGKHERAIRHLAKVNEWERPRARRYVNAAFLDWEERSLHDWDIDLTWLSENFEITLD